MTTVFSNIISQNTEDLRRKDDAFLNLLQLKDDAVQRKDDDLAGKGKIIDEMKASIKHYKKLTSKKEINHFLNIVKKYKSSESKVLDQASRTICDYETFFLLLFWYSIYR